MAFIRFYSLSLLLIASIFVDIENKEKKEKEERLLVLLVRKEEGKTVQF